MTVISTIYQQQPATTETILWVYGTFPAVVAWARMQLAVRRGTVQYRQNCCCAVQMGKTRQYMQEHILAQRI